MGLRRMRFQANHADYSNKKPESFVVWIPECVIVRPQRTSRSCISQVTVKRKDPRAI